MAKYYKKSTVVDAITFNELIEYGKQHAENMVNGIPWSFKYMGWPVTNETDDHYIIAVPGCMCHIKAGYVFGVYESGNVFLKHIDKFFADYKPLQGKDDDIRDQIAVAEAILPEMDRKLDAIIEATTPVSIDGEVQEAIKRLRQVQIHPSEIDACLAILERHIASLTAECNKLDKLVDEYDAVITARIAMWARGEK
jgi:hypothetical protein